MKVRFDGGIKDVPIKEVTAANYIVPSREERFWHVIQEKVEYDRNNGKKVSRPVLQKYDTKSFPTVQKYLKDAGYTITVLHDPIAWGKKNEALRIDAQRKAAAVKAEAEKKRVAAEREQMKAQIRKELLEEMKEEMKKSGKGSSRK